MTKSKLLKTALSAAEKSSAHILSMYGRLSPEEIELKGKNDFVTAVDKESEKIIINEILRHYPDHTILGEESGKTAGAGGYTWIIDPLDGTKNFIQGIPVFAVSIAVAEGEEIIAGVVKDVVSGDVYYAEKGGGAYRNEKPLKVSSHSKVEDAFFATGFPHRNKEVIPFFCKALEHFLKISSGGRRAGAAALDLCWLAGGGFDFFFEYGLSPWDVAAGALIVREAGGEVTDFSGGKDYLFGKNIIASNGNFHPLLVNEISRFYSKFNGSE